MSSTTDARWIGDVWYKNDRSINEVYHRISHGNIPATNEEYYYLHPEPQGKDVVIYVFERTSQLTDIHGDDAKRIRTLSWDKNSSKWHPEEIVWDKTRSDWRVVNAAFWENVPSNWDKYTPLRGTATDDHGGMVLDLLTGMTVGAAKSATVYIVGRAEDKFGTADWEGSFKAVAQHFTTLRAKNSKVQGLINMSVAVTNTADRRNALTRCIDAGLIIVGAAGNESASLDDPGSAADYLPEAIQDDVIIVGALDEDNKIAEISNHGKRVDYWVRGTKLLVAKTRMTPIVPPANVPDNVPDKTNFDKVTETLPPNALDKTIFKKVTGTSFASPIVTGIIACMLSAGQVATRLVDGVQRCTTQDVRDRLDEWAKVVTQEVKQVGGGKEKVIVELKHLRNLPGLVV